MEKLPLIYIGGCGHSGSTLLDLILGGHSEVVSVGEIDRYNLSISADKKCSCGKEFDDCEFWAKVKENFVRKIQKENRELNENGLEVLPYLSFRHIFKWGDIYYPSPKNKEKYEKDNLFLFQSILEASGKKIAVDSSKIPTRALYLYESGLFDMKIIYLVRDGRAFIHSFRKKGEPNFKATAYWTIRNKRMQKIIKQKTKPEDVLGVHYEDLTSNPDKEIKRITEFAGISFEKEMLNFRNKEHHIVGGNPMKNRKETKIKGDTLWKEKLSFWDRAVFGLIGGRMNKKLGYK